MRDPAWEQGRQQGIEDVATWIEDNSFHLARLEENGVGLACLICEEFQPQPQEPTDADWARFARDYFKTADFLSLPPSERKDMLRDFFRGKGL